MSSERRRDGLPGQAARLATAERLSAAADVLVSQRDHVLNRWLQVARAQPFHRALPDGAVTDHIPALFDALVELLRRHASSQAHADVPPNDAAVLAAARAHVASRFDQGLGAQAIVTEFRLLREEIVRRLREVSHYQQLGAEPLLHEALDGAVLLALEALRLEGERRTTSAATRSDELLRLLVERVEDYAMFVLDAEGRVATWNRGAERIKGYAAEEIVGRPYATFFMPEDRDAGKPERLLRRARIDGRVEDEGWRLRKDGSRFWANAVLTALYDARGRLRGYAKVTRDLTERRRAEEQLRLNTALQELAEARDLALAEVDAERRRLYDLFMQAPAAIAEARGADLEVTFANPLYLRLVGCRDAAELIGKRMRDALPAIQGNGHEFLDQAYQSGEPFVANEALVRLNPRADAPSTEMYVNLVCQPTRDAQGEVDGILVHAVDLTEQVSARQRAEELYAALTEERERFAASFNQATAGIAQRDLAGKYLLVNDRFCELLGRPRDELLQLNDLDITHPEDRARNQQLMASQLERGEAYTIEKRYVCPDGGVVWVNSSVSLIRDAGGAPRFVLAVSTDVTDRRRAEEALRLRSDLIEAAHEAIFAWETNDGITFWNRGAEELYGYAAAEALGRRSHELLGTPQEKVAAFTAALERDGRWEGELRHATKDGRQITVESRQALVSGDGHSYVLEATRDVTRQREAEAALRASEARSAILAEASRVLGSSLHYETTLANLARLAVPRIADWCAVDLLDEGGELRRLAVAHIDPEKVKLAQELQRDYPPDPNAERGAAHVVRSGEPELVSTITDAIIDSAARDARHLELLRELGMRSYMAVPLQVRDQIMGAISLVAAESGRAFGLDDLAVAEELARRASVAIENARLYQQAQEAIRVRDDFFAAASHDLKNPLSAIRGNAQVLLRIFERTGAVPPERLTSSLTNVVGSIDDMTRLIDEMLDIARLRLGEPLPLDRVPTDLVELARRAIAVQQAASDRHRLELRTDLGHLIGDWDRDRLQRVLGNLLSNAIKYSPRGGQVTVCVQREADDAVLRVHDQGIGIPPADLPHVFERFARARNAVGQIGGTGIGLATARQIVEQHGGTISVESHEGQGSTFKVRLPLERAAARG